MAAHSSILAWKIAWTAEPGKLPSTGSQRVGHTTEQLHFHFHVLSTEEKNFTNSCLWGVNFPMGKQSK